MQTTIDLLDALRARHKLTSDYQVAQLLKLDRQAISHYRKGRTLGDDTAIRVAELLDLSEGYVLSCMAAERATSDQAKKAWARAAKKLSGVAATIILASAALFTSLPSPSEAAATTQYYVKCFARWSWRGFLRFATLTSRSRPYWRVG